MYVLYDYFKELKGEESAECIEIENRLKVCRKEQGSQIDKAKGILVKDFPKHWTKHEEIIKLTDDEKKLLSEDEITKISNKNDKNLFNNSLAITKRPYFFRYLYSNYNKTYNKYITKFDNRSIHNFGCSINDLLDKDDLRDVEKKFVDEFEDCSPFLSNDSIMNKICRHMEKQVKEIHINNKNKNQQFVKLLKNDYIPEEYEIEKIENLYKKYMLYKIQLKGGKKNKGDNLTESNEHIYDLIRNEAFDVNSNMSNLATIGVIICYEKYSNRSKDFVWKIFGDGLLDNIKNNSNNKCYIPILDNEGEIIYMGKNYSMKEVAT